MEATNTATYCNIEFKPLDSSEKKATPFIDSITIFFEKCINSFRFAYNQDVIYALSKRISEGNPINRVALFGNNWYVTTDRKVAETLLKSFPRISSDNNSYNPFGKSVTVKHYEDNFYRIVPTADHTNNLFFTGLDDNKRLREPILKALSTTNLSNPELISEFMQRFENQCLQTNQFINAMDLFIHYKFAFLCEIGFRCPPGKLNYQSLFQKIIDLHNYAYSRTFNEKLGIFGKNPTLNEQNAYENLINELRETLDIIIESTKDVEGSLVNIMLEARDNENSPKYSDEDIRCNLMTCLEGGSSNPTNLGMFTLWELGQHPEFQETLFAELNEKHMPLLEAASKSKMIKQCYKETLRLYSPLLVLREFKEDTVLNFYNENRDVVYSQQFSKGESLNYSPFFAGRDHSVYDNATTWNPERPHDVKTAPFSFGNGHQLCPGRKAEELSAQLFLAYFMKKYRIESSPENLSLAGSDSIATKEEVLVKFIPREETFLIIEEYEGDERNT